MDLGAEFKDQYRPAYGRFDRIAAPTIGDNEFGTREEGYVPYWRDVRGRTPPPWYWFSASGWQVLSLNSEAPHDADSSQSRWARRVIRRTPRYGTCRIAFFHRPRYSAGRYGDDPGLEPLWSALRRRGRLVVSGHDHNMRRLRAVAGITQLVVGSGGRELYPVREEDSRLLFEEDTRHGAVRLALSSGLVQGSFYSVTGEVLDRFRLGCKRR